MKVKISEVQENPENPRTISPEKFQKLLKSLQQFPEMLEKRPMVCFTDKKTKKYIVLGGNMRLKACNELGFKEVDIILADDWSDDQKKEFLVKDNIGYGEWDFESLLDEYDAELLDDYGLDLPNLDELLNDAAGGGEENEDNIPVPSQFYNSVEGDLYELNHHRVQCASSTEMDTVGKVMNGMFFDMILTDPPYNVDYTGRTKDAHKIMNDKMDDGNFYQFLYDFYTAFGSFTKNGGAWYVWHADSEGANFRKAMIDSGLLLKQCLIWVKNSLVLGRQDYQWRHESCLFGAKGGEVEFYEPFHDPCLYGWKPGDGHNWYNDRKQTTVLEFDRPKRNDIHPTMKPLELMEYQILNSSKPGQIVGDGFLGSGSTLIAAQKTGRVCYGQELDPKYVDVIVKRWVRFMKDNNYPVTVKRNGEDITNEKWIYGG